MTNLAFNWTAIDRASNSQLHAAWHGRRLRKSANPSWCGLDWCLRFVLAVLVQWFQGFLGWKWPTVPATIDIVSVVPIIVQRRGGQQTDGYLATLTYFYRNPELQTGEYSHMWSTDEEAQSWAASYKGSEVMIHVHPRGPSRSVLRKKRPSVRQERQSTYGASGYLALASLDTSAPI